MSRLFVGPWVGEFGWELMCWQSFARALSRQHDETIVICRPTSKPIYQDFATRFYEFDPGPGEVDCCNHPVHVVAKPHGGHAYGYQVQEMLIAAGFDIQNADKWLMPQVINYSHPTLGVDVNVEPFGIVEPEWITYGNTVGMIGYDVILHARWTRKCNSAHRNWPETKWTELAKKLRKLGKTVACIGTEADSLPVPMTINLLGSPLQTVINLLHNAKVFAGPSSGPVHLAMLCNCPHVVWGHPDIPIRYETLWNPLLTPVETIEPCPSADKMSYDGWDADVDEVIERILIHA